MLVMSKPVSLICSFVHCEYHFIALFYCDVNRITVRHSSALSHVKMILMMLCYSKHLFWTLSVVLVLLGTTFWICFHHQWSRLWQSDDINRFSFRSRVFEGVKMMDIALNNSYVVVSWLVLLHSHQGGPDLMAYCHPVVQQVSQCPGVLLLCGILRWSDI
jgi:hypothetical protein